VRAQAFAYASGVILSFLGLAVLLIALQKGGPEAGWGYQMQSPIFVGCLALVLFVVGLNLSGYFEFPVLFGNVASSGAAKDSKLGSFLTGVLAVLVATPCTAPFMAPAIGFALTQSTAVIFAVFANLGLGLAAPFVLISLVPHAIRLLPKPGAWMIIFKQLLAFPMYLSAVWLLWVLAREAGLDAAFVALLGMVLIAFALWLWQRDALLLRVVAVLIVIIGGGAVVTLLHPVSTSQNTLRSHAENFSRARLDALRKEGKAVFVDATADWCITCKVNESVALASPEVMQAFEQQHITYMVADWTHDDTGITQYLESFGRRGVPLYVYYPAAPDSAPVVLPQILTPSIVMKAIAP
jgi:thiol:disulfide interchange protein DsbD